MRILVIGGGIAGLTAAFRLRERVSADTRILLLEAGEDPGGHARTVRDGGFLVETGPNGFLNRADEPEPMALVRDLGLESALIEAQPAARRRFVVHGGRLRRVPDSPVTLLTSDALSPAGRLRVLMEPFAPRAGGGVQETVHDFARRRIGEEAADVLVDPAMSGISAGDSHALAMDSALPRLVAMEREHGSLIRAMFSRRQRPPRLVSFVAGMSTLTDALAAALGDAVRTRAGVRTLSRQDGVWHAELAGGESVAADRVVLATSAARAAEMTSRLDPELSRTLAAFPFAGMAVVALAYRARDLPRPLDGYGYLVARGESLDTMGVVWETSLFAGRAPAGMVLVRAMLGGTRRPDVVHLEEAELIRRARLELARVLGWSADPARAWVWTRPDAIAQYTIGHPARVVRARERAAAHAGLELCGSSYDGISFGSAIQSAERAVTRLLRDTRDRGQSGTERELVAEGVA